jgi:hypothetical protein
MPNFKSITTGLFMAVAAMAMTANTALAAPITIPTGLNPGDQYRLVFVTTTTIASFGNTDIATYNAFVTGVANGVTELSDLSTTWSAIGSTSTVDARDNTGTNPGVEAGARIYLLNDTKLADNNAQFWGGSIALPMNITATGDVLANADVRVWTGSLSDGTKEPTHHLGTAGNTQTAYGLATSAGSLAILGGTTPKGEGHIMYAMSALLTVAGETITIPEPGSFSLLLLGLIGVGFAKRCKTV